MRRFHHVWLHCVFLSSILFDNMSPAAALKTTQESQGTRISHTVLYNLTKPLPWRPSMTTFQQPPLQAADGYR